MKEIYEGILDSVQQRFSDALSGMADFWYLVSWDVIGAALFLAAGALTWFFGGLPIVGKWIRGLGGIAVLLYVAFRIGLQVMANHVREQRERDRAKIKELQSGQRTEKSGGWFS